MDNIADTLIEMGSQQDSSGLQAICEVHRQPESGHDAVSTQWRKTHFDLTTGGIVGDSTHLVYL